MSVLGEIWNTIVFEFSDVADAKQFTEIVVRTFVAAILGGVLGLEREFKSKSAGVRTHMLVAIGAALFVLIPSQAGATTDEISRVIQGIVAGIGFLGAGAIISGSAVGQPRGLTTAASIWLTAAVGVASGVGREMLATIVVLLALFVLYLVPAIVRRIRP